MYICINKLNKMDTYTKKAILNRVEKIIKRVEDEKGHTNGYFVANEILKEVNKLKNTTL